MNSGLSLHVATEYDQVSIDAGQVDVMLTLNAPEHKSEERESRAPIDIVCVIDKSGSMRGDKIELVKKTLIFMVDQLKPCDRIALITFDTFVETILSLKSMKPSRKKKAKRRIERINAGTSTNLSGGLLQGLDIIRREECKSEVISLLVFTDGLANVGITDLNNLVTIVKNIFASLNSAVSLFSFGFGNDHDANMLRALSENGNGLYYYLENNDAIPETFSDCLGGLLSVLAQNIKFNIQTIGKGVKIKKINSSYKKVDIIPNHEIELNIGDIYEGESKHIIVTMDLASINTDIQIQEIIKVTVSYFNIIETESKQFESTLSIRRSLGAPINHTADLALDIQRNRVHCADALEKGRLMANNNNLEEARKHLQDAIDLILHSKAANDTFCQGLVQDLRDCISNLHDMKSYEQVGNKKMNNYWMSNAYERSTNSRSSAQSSYITKSKGRKREFAKNVIV